MACFSSKLENLINTLLDEYEEERLTKILESFLKDILNDETYSDPAMTSTLLNSQDIRTWVTVFAAAEDQEQRRQARKVLTWLIMDTYGVDILKQRLYFG